MAVPPAPELPGEAYLEIFIHPDGPYQMASPDTANRFRDTRSLELLGRKMVDLAYMDIMHYKWPNVTGGQLTVSAIRRARMRTTRYELGNSYRY
ncbi:hypothetical protein TRAPUB_14381 [Trametes pubescens]|uniref:Uncharacterized protein n=1 Tax=Trametes pubescens TaxID=154538 RepID=A0A1M2VNJ0_TRAPU|nr:hypothetical protein TRAPUB_14381 [Trametes pubescens]